MNLNKHKGGMTMDTKLLRARARANLAGNWGVSIGIAAVAALLGALLTGASFLPQLEAEIPAPYLPALQRFANWLNEGIRIGDVTLKLRTGLFTLPAFILGGTLQLGYAQFLLKQHDGKETEFKDLFSQFDRFGTGFAQSFLRTLYTALWSLLFIIPGIVKSYSYAMTPFILAEHPDMTASDAIRRSMDMMDDYKMDLFILELTFFGWNILASMTLNLGRLALNPYENAARAAFYRQLQAKTRDTICE